MPFTNTQTTSTMTNQFKLLIDTVQQLSLARGINTIMEVVRTSARKLTGADGATFILKDNGQCYYADEDAIGPLWKGQRFPMSACISGWAMINRQPAVIEDIYVDSRIPIEAYKPTFVKSLAMVPIRAVDPVGAIGIYWATQHRVSDEELELLQSLADITSVSIENVYVYNELEYRVKQRTEQLEQANKELDAFSSHVSHDLRSPLRAIMGCLNIFIDDNGDKLDTEGRSLIDSALKSAANMNQLIDSLLNFSRLERMAISPSLLPMKRIVEEICNNLKQQEAGREIEFEIQDMPDVMGDAVLIKQVWINLLSNAIKYTGQQAKAEIKIGSEPSTEGIIYFVKDNGAGFDMKYYNNLFGMFQRLHSAEEFKGNGVGLALIQRILVRHGGRVWALSKPGEGAEFYFVLPKENNKEISHEIQAEITEQNR